MGLEQECFNRCTRDDQLWSISETACTVNGAFPSLRFFTSTLAVRQPCGLLVPLLQYASLRGPYPPSRFAHSAAFPCDAL